MAHRLFSTATEDAINSGFRPARHALLRALDRTAPAIRWKRARARCMRSMRVVAGLDPGIPASPAGAEPRSGHPDHPRVTVWARYLER
jgi:hypothetical protein